MFEKIEQFYFDLENWLIQKIDCDPESYDKAVNYYLSSVCPDEWALYVFLSSIIEKKYKED